MTKQPSLNPVFPLIIVFITVLDIDKARSLRSLNTKLLESLTPQQSMNVECRAENDALEEYIREALAQGYICPSTSPMAASFFFI
ncbi:hypothetical protein NFI96_001842 [Prochilodus magdalenae]|nr:hypothetical protein NFI96_001842 [Prochilodus magdalenae]